ncbi:PolC-type DNA polymerase III N-terminal domain-containing protein [Paenibacillus rhizoplanae]
MEQNVERRKRFELLMKQGEIPPAMIDPYFVDGQIERVEISRGNHDWHIVIAKTTLIPAQTYRAFILRMREKLQHIAKVSFLFLYDDTVSRADIVQEYWGMFLEWVQREIPSVNGWLTRSSQELRDGTLILSLNDTMSLELARKKRVSKPPLLNIMINILLFPSRSSCKWLRTRARARQMLMRNSSRSSSRSSVSW